MHFFLLIDIFHINGKLTDFPLSVYANFSATDIWTFTFSTASPLVAAQTLLILMTVYLVFA